MSDLEIRTLERELELDPADQQMVQKLAAALRRARRGWAGEPLHPGLGLHGRERGVYLWAAAHASFEMVWVPPEPLDPLVAAGRPEAARLLGNVPPIPIPGEPTRDGPRPGFWIARYPVSRLQFLPTREPFGSEHPDPDHPVTQVSWSDARIFAAKVGLALPTPGEWRRAALGPPTTCPTCTGHEPAHAGSCRACAGLGRRRRAFPWGDQEPRTPDRCVRERWPSHSYGFSTKPLRDRHGHPARPAGLSRCGAADMIGHVLEWTSVEFPAGHYFSTAIQGSTRWANPISSLDWSWGGQANSHPQGWPSTGFRLVLREPDPA